MGSNELIKKARRFRKAMGGGWRQAGYLAAAGIYALDHHVERLKEDHWRARSIGEVLSNKAFVKNIYPIKTNIIIFELADDLLASDFLAQMQEKGIYGGASGRQRVRFVTHLGFTDEHLDAFEQRLNSVNFSAQAA